MTYEIKKINQEEANRWMRKLYDEGGELQENFERAFHEEKARKEKNKKYWALPSEERRYYIVYINNNAVLLAGINRHLNISSFAKVTKEREFKGKGRCCVKRLIEDILVDKCRDANKEAFSVNTLESRKGQEVFEYLMNNLPKSVRKIERTTVGFTLYIYSKK